MTKAKFYGPGRDRLFLALASIATAAVFTGGPGPDKIIGTTRGDIISAHQGDDLVVARSGRDVVEGGARAADSGSTIQAATGRHRMPGARSLLRAPGSVVS